MANFSEQALDITFPELNLEKDKELFKKIVRQMCINNNFKIESFLESLMRTMIDAKQLTTGEHG